MPYPRKLSDTDVLLARQMYRSGQSYTAIASHFKITWSIARDAILGRRAYVGIDNPVRSDEVHVNTSSMRGSLNHGSVLDEEDVLKLRQLSAKGKRAKELAAIFGISKSTAWKICRRETWKAAEAAPRLVRKRNAARGSETGNAKLNEQIVSYIKWHLNVGVSFGLLAKYFKVHRNSIRNIAYKLTWKHVKRAESAPLLKAMIDPTISIRLRGDRLKSALKKRARHAPTAQAD